MIDTGTQYDYLKFKADIIKTGAFVIGSPFGGLVMQALISGLEMNWYLLIKIPIGLISLIECLVLLQSSYNVMQIRERLIRDDNRRIR